MRSQGVDTGLRAEVGLRLLAEGVMLTVRDPVDSKSVELDFAGMRRLHQHVAEVIRAIASGRSVIGSLDMLRTTLPR